MSNRTSVPLEVVFVSYSVDMRGENFLDCTGEGESMMALALSSAVKKVFSSHVYRVGDKYYLQGDRGPIGHLLMCTIARLVMCYFDMVYMDLVTRLGIMMLMERRQWPCVCCVSEPLVLKTSTS